MFDRLKASARSSPLTWPRARPWRPWVLVLVLLLAVDWYVKEKFVPERIVTVYEPPRAPLIDRTSGNNMGILFRLAERRRAATHAPLIAMVGDSTIMSSTQPRETTLVAGVRRVANDSLRTDLPVDVMEFSAAGMPATDAVVFIAKALGLGVDLVTYSLTPRVLCSPGRRSSDVDRWVMDGDARRELGWSYLSGSFGPEDLARSFLISHWDLYRFRREIAGDVRAGIASLFSSADHGRWVSPYPPTTINPIRKPGPIFTRALCNIDPTNAQVLALRRIIEMCAASGRCLLYHSPINPAARELFEEGLLPQFSRDVRDWTSESSVQFRNYSMILKASGFAHPPPTSILKADAVHMNFRGRSRVAELLGGDAAALLRKAARSAPPQPAGDLEAHVRVHDSGVAAN